MSTDDNGKRPEDESQSSFTIDVTRTDMGEMPSVTKLLNRSALQKMKEAAKPPKAPPAAPPQAAPPEAPAAALPPAPATDTSATPPAGIEFFNTPASDTPAPAVPTSSAPSAAPPVAGAVKPASRRSAQRERSAVQALIEWNPATLKHGLDPMGQGLALLMERGIKTALFLAITPPPPGSPVPHFVATAAVAPGEKIPLWTGLRWDPKVVPELWNSFVRSGVAELSPPGTMTNVGSTRNVVRLAFGLEQDEWLTLLRAGPANGCRGVLAVLSKQSIQALLPQILPLIQALPQVAKKAS